MRTPAQVERDLATPNPALQMSLREFQELTIFLENINKSASSANILALVNMARYGTMRDYLLRLQADIKLHHDTFAPFFPDQPALDS